MTQDVQPLTWQKRTNLEEHQQFFSKINEIIDNLAPTVDEAEAAIAQATAAVADANAAVATANAASTAASAAAQQAQTAAATVAGYDARLAAAEGDIDALQAADQTMAGSISALGTRMTAAESKNSQQDTGIAALQTADAQNVKINRINDYAVGLTGNQTALGNKTWEGNQTINRNLYVVRTGTDVTVVPSSAFNTLVKEVYDGNNHLSASEFVTKNPNGATWNVRNFFHYFKDDNDEVHTVRVGVYYTIENTASTATVKRVINIFVDGVSVSSETEYTKTVNL